jgi:hypothetical protein
VLWTPVMILPCSRTRYLPSIPYTHLKRVRVGLRARGGKRWQ